VKLFSLLLDAGPFRVNGRSQPVILGQREKGPYHKDGQEGNTANPCVPGVYCLPFSRLDLLRKEVNKDIFLNGKCVSRQELLLDLDRRRQIKKVLDKEGLKFLQKVGNLGAS